MLIKHILFPQVDTVTNFTTTAAFFRQRACRNVLVVTSHTHVQRARAIGQLVFGGLGISVSFVACDAAAVAAAADSSTGKGESGLARRMAKGSGPAESKVREFRDIARAVIWLATGLDGASVARCVHPHRN
jgi:hypothetical protein